MHPSPRFSPSITAGPEWMATRATIRATLCRPSPPAAATRRRSPHGSPNTTAPATGRAPTSRCTQSRSRTAWATCRPIWHRPPSRQNMKPRPRRCRLPARARCLGGGEFVTLEIGGQTFVVVDIGMRMLTPRELFNAQGFPADYVIEGVWQGVETDDPTFKPFAKDVQVSCCGNSVCPPLAEAIVRANCAHLAANIEQEAAHG
nr:DNA cytosine methyltransferase [Roseicitreum antarcticum]